MTTFQSKLNQNQTREWFKWRITPCAYAVVMPTIYRRFYLTSYGDVKWVRVDLKNKDETERYSFKESNKFEQCYCIRYCMWFRVDLCCNLSVQDIHGTLQMVRRHMAIFKYIKLYVYVSLVARRTISSTRMGLWCCVASRYSHRSSYFLLINLLLY